MQERLLLRIALAAGTIGILMLFFLSEHAAIDERAIDRLTAADVEADVRVKGVVQRIDDREKVAFLSIAQLKDIDVVLFKDGNLSLKEGQLVEVIGTVDEYEGKVQLIGNEVSVLAR
ncbi:MAG TPA: OB-fold nucleic acid binding domain-containing protein [Candidatus Nanoarchaeia archaeon]|nr:OB-fold nucleic acid binding domain-containing protein [Candidatus Nanoarchaeia archaeon]